MGNLFPPVKKSIMGSLFPASKKKNDEWEAALQRSRTSLGEPALKDQLCDRLPGKYRTPLFSFPHSPVSLRALFLASLPASQCALHKSAWGRVSWTPWFGFQKIQVLKKVQQCLVGNSSWVTLARDPSPLGPEGASWEPQGSWLGFPGLM